MTLGLGLHRMQDDFGTTAAVGSPLFGGDAVRLTLSGGVSWFPHDMQDNEQRWTTYGHVKLAFEGGARIPGSPIRIYGTGAPMMMFLPSRLSDNKVRIGGAGGFGFEFIQRQTTGDDFPMSYFFEAGGVGTGATAEKVVGKPIVGNGFYMNVGFRAYLW